MSSTNPPHRWKNSLTPEHVAILEEAAGALKQAWEWDNESPESYPLNMDHALWETKLQLKGQRRKRKTTKMPAYRRPKCLHDFIDESVVRMLYEQQHSESYQDALERAADGFGAGFAAWRKIVNCLPATYLLAMGGEWNLPKPKVHFLHRELLDIAASLGIDDLVKEGLAEFFDDLCPCGKKHNAETIRKLAKRVTKSRKTRKL
jgi:hypothetical protein